MGIEQEAVDLHWNYFLALEKDMEVLGRYIEFHEDNWSVYSIELAHLLFAAASEVDVVAKRLCAKIDQETPAVNIGHYRDVITKQFPAFAETLVRVPRYGLELTPWTNWRDGGTPFWWTSYNKVKHQRDSHFSQATLKNAFNALAGLLIVIYYDKVQGQVVEGRGPPEPRDVTRHLEPESTLIRFPEGNYYQTLIV